MSADDRLVAVTGATGRQGNAVTRHLLRNGWRVRALTRTPDSKRAQALKGLGADVVRADFDEPDTLRAAFHDAHGVYSVQNPMISGIDGEIRQGIAVADAARDAGVSHVVYGSAGTGASDTGVGSWESKLVIEAHMRQLGLPLTVLRPMAFMELMTDRGYFPPASTWHVMPKLMGADRPVVWLSVDDLGAIAALAFAEPSRFVGADLTLAADVHSIEDCRAIWRGVTGKAPRRIPMPVWLFERIVGDDLIAMWRWLRTGSVPIDTSETLRILPTAVTVRQWLSAQQAPREPHPA
ncbi:MAG: NAD(P)H-binding protein [Actinophytocola sp.]|nr:NAD(P)H-binding protein [Actinophytocola sp.]